MCNDVYGSDHRKDLVGAQMMSILIIKSCVAIVTEPVRLVNDHNEAGRPHGNVND